MVEHPHHPFADLFPMRPGKPLADLAESIAEHGQKEDIVLFEGAILDGRRRQAAAIKAGVELRCREFGSRPGDGDSALEFAFAVNYHRRDDLTVAEKTLAAAKYATAKRGYQHSNGQSAGPPITQRQAAEKFGVNAKAVERAKVIVAKGTPDLQEAVRSEIVTISDAATIAKESPAVQQQALKTVQAGEAPTLTAAMQKGAGRMPDDPAKIGRALTALIQRLERVEAADARLRDLACERLRKGLGFIEELTCAAAA